MDLLSVFRPQCMGIWGFEFVSNNIVYWSAETVCSMTTGKAYSARTINIISWGEIFHRNP